MLRGTPRIDPLPMACMPFAASLEQSFTAAVPVLGTQNELGVPVSKLRACVDSQSGVEMPAASFLGPRSFEEPMFSRWDARGCCCLSDVRNHTTCAGAGDLHKNKQILARMPA